MDLAEAKRPHNKNYIIVNVLGIDMPIFSKRTIKRFAMLTVSSGLQPEDLFTDILEYLALVDRKCKA